MDKAHWQKIREIFQQIADKSPSHRTDFLDIVCEGDPPLRKELDELLHAHDALNRGDDRQAPVFQQETPQPTIIGNYQIDSTLGHGGMGVVFKARHPDHGIVALKVLPGFVVADQIAARRFEQESRALASLSHPNLCGIVESFVTRENACIAMEYLEGRSLDEVLESGPVGMAESVRIVRSLAQGLEPAHEAGIVHRDIKPANVILTSDNRVKLIDFGIAKFADTKLTATGQILGTPGYMSPEQWRGGRLDHRTDLWSLGVLWYEMLSGSRAFAGTTQFEIARSVLSDTPPALDVAYSAAAPIIEGLLEKDPQSRLASCAELLEALP